MPGDCLICGRWEDDHHDYVTADDIAGCTCAPNSWEGCESVPEVCKSFAPRPGDEERCGTCCHGTECHEAAAQRREEDGRGPQEASRG